MAQDNSVSKTTFYRLDERVSIPATDRAASVRRHTQTSPEAHSAYYPTQTDTFLDRKAATVELYFYFLHTPSWRDDCLGTLFPSFI
jgi:hypothetical protein